MNPLEDAIVALRPVSPSLPFKIGDSIRLYDPTMPEGSTFPSLDPVTGNPITVTNEPFNFGWEYVWHCHLLGHEENDMMRPMVFEVSPAAPTTLTVSQTATAPPEVTAAWVDNSTKPVATDFLIQRSTDASFTGGLAAWTLPATPASWVDTTAVDPETYYYRVRAENSNSYSLWSNTASVTVSP